MDSQSTENSMISGSGHQAHSSKNRILIVEDDFYNREILITYLKGFDVEVFVSVNGLDAVFLVEKIPDMSLILMDIHMPVMNGLDATREIKKTHPDIPVIIVTASCDPTNTQEIIDSCCDDYLLKPFTKEDFLQMVRKYLFREV